MLIQPTFTVRGSTAPKSVDSGGVVTVPPLPSLSPAACGLPPPITHLKKTIVEPFRFLPRNKAERRHNLHSCNRHRRVRCTWPVTEEKIMARRGFWQASFPFVLGPLALAPRAASQGGRPIVLLHLFIGGSVCLGCITLTLVDHQKAQPPEVPVFSARKDRSIHTQSTYKKSGTQCASSWEPERRCGRDML